jgi:hypothetical protein
VKLPDARPVAYVRAASFLYFVDTEALPPGSGATGLYATPSGRTGTIALHRSIPPTANTMLAFRCSPHSFHRFEGLTSGERTSIVAWLHLPHSEAAKRWGPTLGRSL